MSQSVRIARHEWRMMTRSRVAQIAVAVILLLSVMATLTSMAQRSEANALRERFQAQADAEFDGQPARHPHRMVHYGHFVFRPVPPLAAFDSGVESYTGHTIFLEGHRQNSANFGDVRQSSLLARFGQMTPAFVLQVLAPLVLIIVGFAAVARERESGQLRLLSAQGVSGAALARGKFMALSALTSVLLLPAAIGLTWLVVAQGAPLGASAGLLAGYMLYLLLWVATVLWASAWAGDARRALMLLIALWAVTSVLIPRIAPDVALTLSPLPTRIETDIAIQEDLRKIGDSHNPDDPHFAAFKARTLAQYGVTRVEDLPVNYRGLLAMEGEKLTSRLFDDYAGRQFAAQRAQSQITLAFAAASPAVALRSLSMALSGTDLEGHRRFLSQAEAYRFATVQRLNALQAEAVTYDDDSNRNKDPEAAKRVRLDAKNWQDVPDFAYRGPSLKEKFTAALPAALLLLIWGLVAFFLFRQTARHIGEARA